MLIATSLKREFLFNDKGQSLTLADPSPSMEPKDVLNFYAGTYPILTTAKISGPVMTGDSVSFTFESVMGTKG